MVKIVLCTIFQYLMKSNRTTINEIYNYLLFEILLKKNITCG